MLVISIIGKLAVLSNCPRLLSAYATCIADLFLQAYIVAVFFIVSLLLCTWTLGLPIPSGLLVPSLMIGLEEVVVVVVVVVVGRNTSIIEGRIAIMS